VEDINLLDAVSWNLVTSLVDRCKDLLVILTVDATETSKGKTVSISPSDTFLFTLIHRSTSRTLFLQPPPPQVLVDVLSSTLGVTNVPKEVWLYFPDLALKC
jgi:hypothetical protein